MPATNQKKAQGEESRRRLLEAAADLVGNGGYSQTSVDAIAQRAGVVKSALYWHFGSKNGLLMAALTHYTSSWVTEVRAATSGSNDPIGRLDLLMAHVRELILERPESRRMVFSLLVERGQHDPEIRRHICDVFEELRKALNDGFSEVLPLIPRERLTVIADGIVCTCDGIFLRWMADGDVERLDSSLAEVRRVVMLRIGHEMQKISRQKP
ncbi:MAG: AcrR family transcriptional regulator [Myxococcota bacterium]